jgi:hypothetical protein
VLRRDIEKKDGKNKAKLDLFQTVKEAGDSNVKDVIINVLVPLSDRKNVEKIRVVAMDKGEFQSKEITRRICKKFKWRYYKVFV